MNAVVAMNEETRRIEQFNDIVANIKPLMTTGKGKNQRLKMADMGLLSIGLINDMYSESRNDEWNYCEIGMQEDMDSF